MTNEHRHEHADGHDAEQASVSDATPRWDAAFWDERYGSSDALWSGHVNAVVRDEAAGLPAGRALDVGCGEGGDALWLAGQGWEVLGIDVSRVALGRAAARARDTSLDARTTWEHRDLLAWTPPRPTASSAGRACAAAAPCPWPPCRRRRAARR